MFTEDTEQTIIRVTRNIRMAGGAAYDVTYFERSRKGKIIELIEFMLLPALEMFHPTAMTEIRALREEKGWKVVTTLLIEVVEGCV